LKIYSPLPKTIQQKTIVQKKDIIDPLNPMVRREGTNLMLENQKFQMVGVNFYDLAYKNNDVIDQTFATLHNAGVTTIRFWLFGDGTESGFQPTPEEFNRERFKQVDYILYEANKYNMKVIPVLVNNWTDYGGKDQYIQWIGANPDDETAFYKDSRIRSLFENYISYVLSRKNTYTNKTYADDPAILGWDIMNEPRSDDQGAMNSWLISVATFVKQHDPNHLVFAGTEVAVATSSPNDVDKSSGLCADPVIDVCSIHLYLFNNTQPLFSSYTAVENFMKEEIDYANQVNKPLIMEEFGIAQNTKPFGQDQLSMMKQLLQVEKEDGYAGYLIWDWSNVTNSSFTFSPDGTGDYSLADLEQLLQ